MFRRCRNHLIRSIFVIIESMLRACKRYLNNLLNSSGLNDGVGAEIIMDRKYSRYNMRGALYVIARQ